MADVASFARMECFRVFGCYTAQACSFVYSGYNTAIFLKIRENLNAFLADFMIRAKIEDALSNILEQFLEIGKRYHLFLSAERNVLFNTEMKWAGRVLRKGF